MPSRSDIVAEARTWIGTPFHHQGRKKGVGVDCAGLIIGVAHNLGISTFDTTGYGREPQPDKMGAVLNEHLDRINKDAIEPGDILWIAMHKDAQHLALVTENGMIHASSMIRGKSEKGRVVEHRLSGKWLSRVFRAYRFRGVE